MTEPTATGPTATGGHDIVADVVPADDGDPPAVTLYGTPEGLRWLAGELLRIAGDPNRAAFRGEGDHWHYAPEGGPGPGEGLHPLSRPLTVGRLDDGRGETAGTLDMLRLRRGREAGGADA